MSTDLGWLDQQPKIYSQSSVSGLLFADDRWIFKSQIDEHSGDDSSLSKGRGKLRVWVAAPDLSAEEAAIDFGNADWGTKGRGRISRRWKQ